MSLQQHKLADLYIYFGGYQLREKFTLQFIYIYIYVHESLARFFPVPSFPSLRSWGLFCARRLTHHPPQNISELRIRVPDQKAFILPLDPDPD